MTIPAHIDKAEAFTSLFQRNWFAVSLLLFIVAATLGAVMRLMYVHELPWATYNYLKHAHSHVALMGWAFFLIVGLLLFTFIGQTHFVKHYKCLFNINLVVALGMAVSFSLQGYGTMSIIFSTIHLFCAYGFAWLLLKDLRRMGDTADIILARWGIYWLAISSLGLWMIPVSSVLWGKFHPMYFMSVQFFLHFQFNGWLTFTVLAAIIRYYSMKDSAILTRIPINAIALLNVSLLLTYTLSITWSTPIPYLYYINSFGVVIQLAAILFILQPIFKDDQSWKEYTWPDVLLLVGIASLLLKFIIQFVLLVPILASEAYGIRGLVIGFVHLLMLGGITLSGLGILLKMDILPQNHLTKMGGMVLLAAFVLTEILLLGQGVLLWMKLGFLPYYHEGLFLFSALFPLGLVLMLLGELGADLNKYINIDISHIPT